MMSSMVDSKAGRAPRPSSGLDMAGLGARLRMERLRRRLSLHDLEARTGVSRSMLSEVERGSKVPTVLVLDRIATGLDTSIARLLGEERATRVVVLRRGEHDTAYDSSGWERRILSPVLPGVEFELMRTTIAPPALDPEHFRRLAHDTVDLVAAYLAGISTRPVFRPMTPAERATLMQEPLGAVGLGPEVLLERVRAAVLPHAMGNGHPRFFGWVNSPPAPVGVLADLLAAALNPSCAGGDHAAIYVERAAVRWLMELIGFPTEGSMGLLASGGSAATFIALAAARHRAAIDDGWNVRRDGLQRARSPFVLYASQEGHSCIQKAAELLGLGTDAIQRIATDENYRMDVGALRAASAADRAVGKRPFCVAASAGTVSTGAIDPLAELADLCAAERLWLHVDGAYGAVAAALPTHRARYAGLERADSIALDPHKWLSVPVECGAVLVRDGSILRSAFSLVPDYLRTEPDRGFGGLPWYSEFGVQQTRGFRALKLWMTFQHLG